MSISLEASIPDIDPAFGLIYEVTEQLIPLFAMSAVDITLARAMALSAIEAYEPLTRADYVNVARTIALSITSLALLGHAAAKDLPMPEKLRVIARANAINRTADQSERTMMQRQRQHQTTPPAEQPLRVDQLTKPPEFEPAPNDAVPTPSFADTELGFSDPRLDAATAEAIRLFAACAPAGTAPLLPRPQPEPTPRTVAARPLLVPKPPPRPPAIAIHHRGTASDPSPARESAYKQELLSQTAMQRVIQQTGFRNPA